MSYLIESPIVTESLVATILDSAPPPMPIAGSDFSVPFLQAFVTKHQPTSDVHGSAVGNMATGFADDFYNRVHIEPSKIELGNLLSTQTRNVRVWNAHMYNITLNSITDPGESGLSLTQPYATPLIYDVLAEYVYQVVVSINGSPNVDGTFTFHFDDGENPTLEVLGNRVVLWPYMPQNGYTEYLEWKTNVMRSRTGEQRTALRNQPRQSFDYVFWMNDKQYGKAKAMAAGWGNRTFGVPVWSDVSYLGAVPAGTTSLTIDTTASDYRADDVLLLWESDTKYEVCQTTNLTATTISLTLPTAVDFTQAYVAPVRYGRSTSGMNARRSDNNLITVSNSFLISKNTNLAASIGLPTYQGYDVLTDMMMKVSDYNESFIREVSVIDNGMSVTEADPLYTTYTEKFMVSWTPRTKAELWRIRKWLHSRKGKQKSFWLPSNLSELKVLDNMGATSTGMRVEYIGHSLYYNGRSRHAMITMKSGIKYFVEITSAEINVDGTETLSLAEAIGTAINAVDIDRMAYMYRVRLDTDSVEIHYDVGLVTIAIPVAEVPE